MKKCVPLLLLLCLLSSCAEVSDTESTDAPEATSTKTVRPPGFQPLMGWSSKTVDGAEFNETYVKTQAAYMAEHLRPFGWQYLLLDGEWNADAIADRESTSGKRLMDLVDYLHSLDLKVGLQLQALTEPTSAYEKIFQQLAALKIDHVQMGGLSQPYQTAVIENIHRAIEQCGRDIVFSLSAEVPPVRQAEHLQQHVN
ncbi:MAG: hypothetical protein AAFO94_06170, partial [Bacteroidota bacterium]